ncbi:MAG: B12-binding domain-containing radical SAM protein [Desulfobacterales bacterium]|nr:MAG: B12-binding domain-containing radical SAM protein [Desulfobacterales bacterium]
MPDILLIQPPIRDFYLTAKRTIPYGLACIASTLTECGFTVEILDGLATSKSRLRELPREMSYLREYYGQPDCSPFALFNQYKHFGYSFDHIGRKARESGAFLIGISSLFTPYAQEAVQTAETVKAYHPDCKVVMGGHHPTALPHAVMESAAVDFVVRGEGEVPMPLLARALSEGGQFDTIPGLVFRREDGSLHINSAAQMRHPDIYPLPAAELINRHFYRRRNGGSMVIVAGRGCPLACSYCSVGAHSPLAYRQRSVDSVMREIEQAVDTCEVGFIDFEDENLSFNRRWFLRLLQAIKSRFGDRLELRAMNGLYPPSLDEEVIRTMKSAGFKTLNLSLGATSKEQLGRFNRPDVRDSFNRALELAKDYHLNAVGYIICGAPFQHAQDSISDLLYLSRRRVLAGVSIFYPSPGSQDYDLCARLKLLPSDFACMRSSALPLSHTTTRKEAVTLLRLARIINFMKSLLDQGICLPEASSAEIRINDAADRIETGKQLLARFLADGKIRGVTPEGHVFEHAICERLSLKFLKGFAATDMRGSR